MKYRLAQEENREGPLRRYEKRSRNRPITTQVLDSLMTVMTAEMKTLKMTAELVDMPSYNTISYRGTLATLILKNLLLVVQ